MHPNHPCILPLLDLSKPIHAETETAQCNAWQLPEILKSKHLVQDPQNPNNGQTSGDLILSTQNKLDKL